MAFGYSKIIIALLSTVSLVSSQNLFNLGDKNFSEEENFVNTSIVKPDFIDAKEQRDNNMFYEIPLIPTLQNEIGLPQKGRNLRLLTSNLNISEEESF